MMNFLKYGPPRKMVKAMLMLSWPLMIAAKKLNNVPVVKWIINPFFAYPWNEVTMVPIGEAAVPPESIALPRRVVERFVSEVDDLFILDECICRSKEGCNEYSRDIGCMALGPGIARMHPSHGRKVTKEEAVAHVQKAAKAGLVASFAHVWIDPVAFGLSRFHNLMFICFCCDCCSLYRTHMTDRGPNLERGLQKLPGISVTVDTAKCTGCGMCVDRCFAAAMTMNGGAAAPGESCKGCGRCVELCPEGAVTLRIENEDALYRQLMGRVQEVADIWQGQPPRA